MKTNAHILNNMLAELMQDLRDLARCENLGRDKAAELYADFVREDVEVLKSLAGAENIGEVLNDLGL